MYLYICVIQRVCPDSPLFPVFSARRYRRNGFEEYRMREREGELYITLFSLRYRVGGGEMRCH